MCISTPRTTAKSERPVLSPDQRSAAVDRLTSERKTPRRESATSPRAQNRFQAVRESNDFGVFLKSRRGDSATDDRAALTSTCEEDTVKTHGFFFSLLFSLFVRDASAPPLPRGLPPPRHGLQASLGSIERDENLTGTRSLFFAPRADRARTPRRASPALHASTRRTSKIRFLPRGS